MADSAQSTDAQIYGRLLSYVVPYWPAFLLSIAGFLLYSIANVSFLGLISYIVDSLQGRDPLEGKEYGATLSRLLGEPDSLNRTLIPLGIVCIAFLRGIGTFIGNYFITYISTNLVHNLRCELFEQLMRLPSRFFDKSHLGHLVAKVTFHVTQVTGAATDAVRVIIREGFTVLGYLGLMIFLNWKLTLIFFAVAPLIALLVTYAGRRFRRISERIQDSMGDVTHVASEAVQGYRVVRTFGGAAYERQRFNRVSHDNRRQSMKMVVTASIATPVIQVLVAVALAGLVWLVLDPLLLADMTAGNVVVFISTSGLLAKPIRQLSEVNVTVQKGLAAAEDIFDVFDQEIEVDQGVKVLTSVKGRVCFDNVSFGYGEGRPEVLDSLSFTVEPGETIALVGRSGSGKSTLASLIPRFYSPTSGRILVDDTPIEELTLQNLRSHIAVVPQDVTLFNDSVANNIAYGTLNKSSRELVIDAARKAYAWPFITELEQGLDTQVGDDGVLLSGGQRQRLAIARAFLKDAPILILDEATSSLDAESERYIQSALEEVVKGRTTFIIAHRLSTVENADRILVIDNGRIVEQGSHEELLNRNGHYAQQHRMGQDEFSSKSESRRLADTTTQVVSSRERQGWDFHPLVRAWYNDSSWLRLLEPFSVVFTQLAKLKRRRSGRNGWRSPVPVVVVGNISVGGTGKSPLVIWLAEQLSQRGLRPGVVSRGYGGRSVSYPLDVDAATDPLESGDEAQMIARRTGLPVVVDPDRVSAVQHLLAIHDCDIVISDDGLQHYSLHRDVEIAVIDGDRGLGNGRCLPAGPLREPPERLREVDFIVSNGPLVLTGFDKEVTEMTVVPTALVNLDTGERRSLNEEFAERVHAVAGIAHPERFFESVHTLGIAAVEHPFADHHVFSQSDLIFDEALPILMTEKDAVKCRHLSPELLGLECWYLEVEACLPDVFAEGILETVDVQRETSEMTKDRMEELKHGN